MSNSKRFYEEVERGMEGYNKGIDFTVPKLNEATGGIMREQFYLILGKSKSGKSSFLYDQFIFNLIDKAIKGEEFTVDDLVIYLYSFEINAVKIYAKAVSNYLLKYKGIVTTPKQILGWKGKPPLSLYKILQEERLKSYLRIVDQVVVIIENGSPANILRTVGNACVELSDPIGVNSEGTSIYRFKNNKQKVLLAVDHLSLIDELKYKEGKKTFDILSNKVLRSLKEKFGLTSVLVQQITPKDEGKLYYGHSDSRDTKNTFQDCDVCLSINSPFHEGFESVPYKNGIYHITPNELNGGKAIGDYLRLISIEKDRWGNSNLRLPASFIGQAGLFKEIADPRELNYDDYDIQMTFK